MNNKTLSIINFIEKEDFGNAYDYSDDYQIPNQEYKSIDLETAKLMYAKTETKNPIKMKKLKEAHYQEIKEFKKIIEIMQIQKIAKKIIKKKKFKTKISLIRYLYNCFPNYKYIDEAIKKIPFKKFQKSTKINKKNSIKITLPEKEFNLILKQKGKPSIIIEKLIKENLK